MSAGKAAQAFSTMDFVVVIPARFASTRLPGKPLRELAGKPLIQHVFERALESGARTVMVATDDERVAEVAQRFGALAMLTDPQHTSGSERIAEVVTREAWSLERVVVNLQGDEPFMPASMIRCVAADLLQRPEVPMSTLGVPLHEVRDLFDPNVVKLIRDEQGFALYFSRAPIPWDRDHFPPQGGTLPPGYFRHVGLYGYRVGFLKRYVTWPSTGPERLERLEQLRVLGHGERIYVSIVPEDPGFGVDTEEDLRRAEHRLKASSE